MNHKPQPLVKRFSYSSDSQLFTSSESETLRLNVLSQLVVLETLCFPKPLGALFFQDGFLRADVFIDILLLRYALNQEIPEYKFQSFDMSENSLVLAGYAYYQKFVDEMHFIQIATHPLLRRQGYGKLLVEHAILTAKVEGCHSFWLEVREGNQVAISLYEKLGFNRVSQRKKYYSDNGENAWVMKKTIDHFHQED